MLRVRDIMTVDVVSLAEDSSVDSAAWKLANEDVSGAPVRDAKGNVIGVLSKSDLVDPLRQGDNEKLVSHAMTPGVWAVHPDERAIDAVKLMIDVGVHRVLVIRGPGKLEGIVSTMDVMKALVRGADFHGLSNMALQPDNKKDEAEKDEESDSEGDDVAAGMSA
ncbi:MAG: CBS domain-containing protein [Proteobacteria bacterium]|nr:CBS domain-containing protein [Pseudomonadota bacterium]